MYENAYVVNYKFIYKKCLPWNPRFVFLNTDFKLQYMQSKGEVHTRDSIPVTIFVFAFKRSAEPIRQ